MRDESVDGICLLHVTVTPKDPRNQENRVMKREKPNQFLRN